MNPLAALRPVWSARLTHAGIAALLAGGLAAWTIAHPGTWPLLVAAAILPDLPLLAGMSHDAVPGRLHPRAVPAYNATHVLRGPALLAALSLAAGPGALTAALAWALHIAIDRACGYGLRTRAGDQRTRRP